jgi:ubiquinone/menaquinone biosynthesis C-methylase UbiE
MNTVKTPSFLLSTANSTRRYYKSMNNLYVRLFGKHLMLHYPYYKSDFESLEKRQVNLTDYCLSHVESLLNKQVLEVGCGNGIQALYIADALSPLKILGIDLNPDNISIALQDRNGRLNIDFYVDDAQKLDTISDNSIDVLLCIESAFHYPQKELFLDQIKRVLKPSGEFVITDIINKSPKRKYITQRWKNKMAFHHWTEVTYLQSFTEAGLDIRYKENITSQVLKGYQGSNKWIRRENCGSFLSFLLFKVFAVIQLGINTHLLKKKEDYILFVGSPVKL